jgi:hypothetical protein
MDPKKLSTIADWPPPSSVKQVQKWLGFTNFYRRFIHGYASLAAPLNDMTKKDDSSTPFVLSPAAQESFFKLRNAFQSAPLLRHFSPSIPITVTTDASDFALGAIVHQADDNDLLHPIGFFSRKFTPAEINYDVHDKELLAIIETFCSFRAWLMGSPHHITVRCDHKNLQYFMTRRVLNRRQARWSMFLNDFHFVLDFLPGISNPADGPSRRSDFELQEGDKAREEQSQQILNDFHCHRILNISLPSASSTPLSHTLGSQSLLESLREAYKTDIEWRHAIELPNSTFELQDTLVYHNNKLYFLPSLRLTVLNSGKIY